MIDIRYFMSLQTGYDTQTGCILSSYQLLTKREKERKFPTLKDSTFLSVHVAPKDTYWFMGARFARDNARITRD